MMRYLHEKLAAQETSIANVKQRLVEYEGIRTQTLAEIEEAAPQTAARRKELNDAVETAQANIETAKANIKTEKDNREAAEAKAEAEVEADYQSAVAREKKRYQAEIDNQTYCRLQVEMPPLMPPPVKDTLVLLYATPRLGIEKFAEQMRWGVGGGREWLLRNFEAKAKEVLAAAKQGPAPPTLLLTGAVTSDDELRVYGGVVQVSPDDRLTYYTVEDLRQAQTKGLAIEDEEIENQAVFIEHLPEIWNAPYPRL